ncbi:prepilin-type N-terminal cleavage/methylation domain-containing protein [bacterium]|nr:prepilin-type N-terminal cleavage/methylation domain-containing protein [bacterium]
MRIRKAFTLAEVLITLGVIGVVAAITLPSFMENVTERINSERQANIAYKVTQAMEQMRAHGLLNTQYASTDAFVDELQKYLKIAKRCDSSNISDCWPVDRVTTADGEEFEVSKAKIGKNLSLSTDTNNVGLILADGAPIILNYNPETDPIDVGDRVETKFKGLPVGFGKSKEFAYTSDVTKGIDFVMDVNGSKSPNSEVDTGVRDIRSFKSAKFSRVGPDCSKYPNSFEVPDVGCVVNVGIDYEPAYRSGLPNNTDYWLGAQNKCASLNNMHLPDLDELGELFKRRCNSYNNPDYNADTCISDIPAEGWYWSSVEFNNYFAYGMAFDLTSGNYNGVDMTTKDNIGSYGAKKRALCVGN